MKIFRIIPYITILLMISLFLSGYTQESNQDLPLLIKAGKTEIYHFRFDRALQIFKQVQEKYPDYPHGYFYECYITAILFSQDKSNSKIDSLLHSTVDKSIKVAQSFRKKMGDTPEADYYLGLSHGVLGIYHVLNHSYLNAYIHGRKGKNYLESAVKLDSTYYDAYLGLGIFHYYVDLLPGIIKFFAKILGFSGDREKGIREILLTANKGKNFKIEAQFAYASLRYFLEGEQFEGLNIFKKLKKKFPKNPAVTLLIGYHYRRNGRVQRAIPYFEEVPNDFSESLPQITVMKYYNLGVCYFRLNNFDLAEKYFNRLMDNKLRKSSYYRAALAYYKGLLAAMRSDYPVAEYYLRMIHNTKDMQYWFNSSRIFVDHPVDSIMVRFITAENDVFTSNYRNAEAEVGDLMNMMKNHPNQIKNPDLIYLIYDLEARLYFRKGRVTKAKSVYVKFGQQIEKIDDEFQRAWVYIGFARVLREARELQNSEKFLEKARKVDDEYTKLIVERELYIIKKMKQKKKV